MANLKKEEKFEHLYGPVSSWRLGSSLGVDLIFKDKKICSFDCVYCQLGETQVKTKKRQIYIPTEEIIKEIKMLPPDLSIDYITFSGTGEPTLAKNLGGAIREIKALRKEKIAVITNSSLMWDRSIREELSLSDFVMAKLDAAGPESFEKINKPIEGIKFKDVYEGIRSFKMEYDTKLAIQIMFLEENKNEFEKLAELAFEIIPDEIQINTPLRPHKGKPLSQKEITHIREYFEDFGRRINSKAKIISPYEARQKDVEAISEKDTLRRRGKIE